MTEGDIGEHVIGTGVGAPEVGRPGSHPQPIEPPGTPPAGLATTPSRVPTRALGHRALARRRPPVRGRTIFNVILVALIVGSGVYTALAVSSSSSSPTVTSTATVTRGTVQATQTATGNVAAAQTYSLNFAAAGTVSSITVSVGQPVTQGQVLATVDPTAAQATLTEAQYSLSAAQDRLSQDQSGTSSAGSNASGQGSSGDSASSTATSGSTGSNTNSAGSAPSTSVPTSSSGTTSSSTTPSTTTAPSTTTSPSTTTTTSAPNPATIASDEQAIVSAQASVKAAQLSVDNTTLSAPASGTITAISGQVGQTVSAGSNSSTSGTGNTGGSTGSGSTGLGSAASTSAGAGSSESDSSSSSGFMTLTDLSQLNITCDIAEADIGQITVGQPATVTLNALSGQGFAATVSAVNSTGTSSSSVVTYPVTLTLVNPSPQVKVGMSANVTIVTDQLDDVLVVPSSALRGSGKTSTVTVESAKGIQTQVPVVVGLAGSSTTGVYGALSVGQKVVLPTVTISPNTSSSTGTGTGTLGGTTGLGGGGFGGGGFGGRGFSGGGFRVPSAG